MAYDTATTKRLLRSNNIQGSFLTVNDVKYVNSQRVAAHQIMTQGDILICMANGSKALVGKAGRFHINDGCEYTFGAFMGCFRTVAGLADPEFVSYLFQTGQYQNCVGDLLAGSSINNLKPSSIESLELEFPSQAEQTSIAAVLSDIDAELTALEARRNKTRVIKQAMMQQLLSGKIRLK
jgi:type I restriction enzyme S subunit